MHSNGVSRCSGAQVLLWTVLCLSIGCGAEQTTNLGDRDAAIPLDAANLDGGTSSDLGTVGDGGLQGFQGSVFLTYSNVPDAGPTTGLSGYFTDAPDVRRGPIPGCLVVGSVGPCVHSRCSGLLPSLSAGILTAQVDGMAIGVVVQVANPFYLANVPGRHFTAGQLIGISATGGAVPAFNGNVVAPQPLTITLPTTYAAGASLTLDWDNNVAADEVEVTFSGSDGAISCIVPASSATLTIDGSLIAGFSGTTLLVARAENIASVTAGAYRVAIIASDAIGTTLSPR